MQPSEMVQAIKPPILRGTIWDLLKMITSLSPIALVVFRANQNQSDKADACFK